MPKHRDLMRLCGAASVLMIAFAAGSSVAQNKDAPTLKYDPKIAKALAQKPFALTAKQQQAINARVAENRKARRIEGLRDKIPAADWIDVAYHGGLYDANFEPVVVDAKTAFQIQDSMFAIFSEASDPNLLAKIYDGDLRKYLAEFKAEGDVEPLILRSTILEAMLGALPDEVRARYQWRHTLLQREIRALDPKYFAALHPDVLRRLLEGGFRLPPGGWLDPVEPSTAYMDACRAENVPIPPDFPHADWRSQGSQSVEFILDSLYTEVFAFRAPNGVCYALPRTSGALYSSGGSVQYDGIICQSATTGKACFWDNIDRASGAKITGNPVSLVISNLKDGSNLAENCTECHRGSNVFNIHPGTAVDLSRPSTPGASDGRPYTTSLPVGVRYSPIGGTPARPWTNPALSSLASGGYGCTSCHEIADPRMTTAAGTVNGFYCEMLRMAAVSTMPPRATPAGWPAPPSASNLFDEHTNALRALCGGS